MKILVFLIGVIFALPLIGATYPKKIVVFSDTSIPAKERYCAELIQIMLNNGAEKELYGILENDSEEFGIMSIYRLVYGFTIGKITMPTKDYISKDKMERIKDALINRVMYKMDTLMCGGEKEGEAPQELKKDYLVPMSFETKPLQDAWRQSDKRQEKAKFVKYWCDSILALPL